MPNLNMIAAWVQARLARLESDEGATAVEYGLLVALIAIVLITAVTAFGTNVAGVFNKLATTKFF